MELLFFLLGVLFVSYVIPLLDGLSTLFLAWIETKKISYSELINQTNINMRRAVEEAEEDPPKKLIGFCREDDDDYQEEEDDEDEI